MRVAGWIILRIADCGLRIGRVAADSAIRNPQSAIRFRDMNATPKIPVPVNEPVLSYAPGTSERLELKKALKDLSSHQPEIPLVIGDRKSTRLNSSHATLSRMPSS